MERLANGTVVQVAEIAGIGLVALIIAERFAPAPSTTPSTDGGGGGGYTPPSPSRFLPPVNDHNIGVDLGIILGELPKNAINIVTTALNTAMATAGVGTLVQVGGGALAWYYRKQLIGVFKQQGGAAARWVFQAASNFIKGKPPTPPAPPSAPAPVTAPSPAQATAAATRVKQAIQKGKAPVAKDAQILASAIASGVFSKALAIGTLGVSTVAAIFSLAPSISSLAPLALALA